MSCDDEPNKKSLYLFVKEFDVSELQRREIIGL